VRFRVASIEVAEGGHLFISVQRLDHRDSRGEIPCVSIEVPAPLVGQLADTIIAADSGIDRLASAIASQHQGPQPISEVQPSDGNPVPKEQNT
jgi:hypothetical protein